MLLGLVRAGGAVLVPAGEAAAGIVADLLVAQPSSCEDILKPSGPKHHRRSMRLVVGSGAVRLADPDIYHAAPCPDLFLGVQNFAGDLADSMVEGPKMAAQAACNTVEVGLQVVMVVVAVVVECL